tara:strand:- start:913 stop:1740 length:828 start_codon:yes stop_codon:yes gene_type:complete
MLLSLTLLATLASSSAGVPAPTHTAVAASQDDAKKGPTEEQVSAALKAIDVAFGSKEDKPNDRIAAVQSAEAVVHPKVIDAVAKALTDDNLEVRAAALEALSRMRHDDALAALLAFGKKQKKALWKDEDRYVAFLKAVARHEAPSTIGFFSTKLFDHKVQAVASARILSLGRIRTTESIDALMDSMRQANAKRVQGHMKDYRLALVVLTGQDNDLDPERWHKWWRANKKTFEVPEKMAPMEKDLYQRWNRFWGGANLYERNPRRDERGQDPEDGK